MYEFYLIYMTYRCYARLHYACELYEVYCTLHKGVCAAKGVYSYLKPKSTKKEDDIELELSKEEEEDCIDEKEGEEEGEDEKEDEKEGEEYREWEIIHESHPIIIDESGKQTV